MTEKENDGRHERLSETTVTPASGPEPSLADSPAAPPVRTPERKPWSAKRMWKGIGLIFLMHLGLLVLSMVLGFIPIIFIGIAQLIYVIPAAIIFRRDTAYLQGILIAAGLTFLLNAACYGVIFAAL